MRVAPSLVVFVAACSEFEISKQPEPEEILTPDIVVDPPSIDFGMVSSGGFEVRTVTILNQGDEALEVDDAIIASGIGFSVDASNLPITLAAGEETTFDVRFDPMGAENYGAADVSSNDPDSPIVTVDLFGAGGVPSLQITPATYNFGDDGEVFIPCGAEVDIEFKNVGTEALEITDVEYRSGGQLTFDPRGHALPLTLEPGEAIEVGVVFEATVAGADTGTIEVTSNDPRGVVTADQNAEGVYADEVTESFLEPGIPPVDVMFLIDNSCSMADDNRDDIRQGVPDFIAELENVSNFQLIQVTKDSGCANGGVITPSTPNASDLVIDNAFNAGIFEQLTTEALLKQAHNALKLTDNGECNEGFLRPGALLHIIVASDEEDQSGNNAEHWIDLYEGYVSDPALVKVSAIVDVNRQCGDNTGPGEYRDAATLTGGVVLDICSPDWGSQMTDIASEVLAGIRSYNLANPTEESTITVAVNGVATTDFSYSAAGNTVTINSPPVGQGDVVEITYFPAGECN